MIIFAEKILTMLQEIKIKNFKSFKEEAELSFEAYSDDTNQLSRINSVRNLFRNYKDEGIYIYKTR